MLLITRTLMPEIMARAAREHETRCLEMVGPLDPDRLLANLDGVDAILCTGGDRFDARLIDALPAAVKVLSTYSVGLEHIDLAAAAARGLAVRNTPGVLSNATAEIALCLILMASRRAGEGERIVRARKWDRATAFTFLGHDVCGKRLGIFGMGRIGQRLAQMARGLDMTIHYHNRHRLPPELEAGATYHANDRDLLGVSEILSINAPGTAETHHWLNAERLALLPRGSFVVNTGRGSIVEDAALIEALRSGHVAGAGLDVFENEPNIHSGYLELENVVLLPHIGSATVETRLAMGNLALDNVNEVLNRAA